MGLLARILPVVNRFASCKSQPPWLDHIWNTDSGPHPLFSQKSSWKIKNELPGQRSAARFGFAPTFDDATRYEYPRCHHQKAQKTDKPEFEDSNRSRNHWTTKPAPRPTRLCGRRNRGLAYRFTYNPIPEEQTTKLQKTEFSKRNSGETPAPSALGLDV